MSTKIRNQTRPVITFGSSKGGPGKSTACCLLAAIFAEIAAKHGQTIAIIDNDKNQHSGDWGRSNQSPSNIVVYKEQDLYALWDLVEQCRSKHYITLIDNEGTGNDLSVQSMFQSDLVLVMCKPSPLDFIEAKKTIKEIRHHEKTHKNKVNYKVLFTETKSTAAVTPRLERIIIDEFIELQVPMFGNSLSDRTQYKSIFSVNADLQNMLVHAESKYEKEQIKKAITNCRNVCKEVIGYMNEVMGQQESSNKYLENATEEEGV